MIATAIPHAILPGYGKNMPSQELRPAAITAFGALDSTPGAESEARPTKRSPTARQVAALARRRDAADARQEAIAAARKAERDHTAARRATKKAVTTALTSIYRALLTQACKAPPEDYQSWGVTRTRAWVTLAGQGLHVSRLLHFQLVRAGAILGKMSRIDQADVDELTQIITRPQD